VKAKNSTNGAAGALVYANALAPQGREILLCKGKLMIWLLMKH